MYLFFYISFTHFKYRDMRGKLLLHILTSTESQTTRIKTLNSFIFS